MRKSISLVAVAMAALITVTSSASAAELTQITSAKLSEILTAITGKATNVSKPEAGVEIVSIVENGSYDFVLSDCTAQGCATMQMTMFFNKEDIFTLALVNGFNSKDLSATAFLTPDNRVYLVNLFITDGGVTEENIKANLAIYLRAPGKFAKFALSQTTAALPSAGVPVAASGTAVMPARLEFIERVLRNLPRRGHTLVQVR